MKITQALCKHNIGRLIKWQWRAQRRKTVIDTGAEKMLVARGVPVVDAGLLVREPLFDAQKRTDVRRLLDTVVGPAALPVPRDATHPLWHDRPCLVYGDGNALVRGLEQAQVFTNTVLPDTQRLPLNSQELYDAYQLPDQDKHVQRIVESTVLYDAVQEKLPRKKDPKRPAWRFPREYGVPTARRSSVLLSRLLQLCESSVGGMTASKVIAKDATFRVPLKRGADCLSLNLRADILLLSNSPLPLVDLGQDDHNAQLPDLYPLESTVSLDEVNIFVEDDFVSPISSSNGFNNVHTAFINYDETEVQNLYETPVLETQIFGRSLMKSYAFAVANARTKYGKDVVGDLSEPITLQCVQTNSQWFLFSVFQLNSLAGPGEDGKKNFYWQTPLLNLYGKCDFVDGVPILEDYDPEVFKLFLSFYMNGTEYEVK